MKDELEKNIKADKKARAKRGDIEAMQERFDAIITVLTADNVNDCDMVTVALKIAHGDSLDDIVQEAGLRALGLTPPVSEGS